MSINRTVGLDNRNGALVGRDPRDMTTDELSQLGHERISPLKALRLRCVDCCVCSPSEVRLCVSVTCPSWPFRMGRSPWRQPMSDAARERLARSAFKIAATQNVPHKTAASVETQEGGATILPGAPRAARSTTGMGSKSEGGHDH